MATYSPDLVKVTYAGRVLTAIRGSVTPPRNNEDRAGAMGVANGGVISVIGSDQTGEATVPVPVHSADHQFLVETANRLFQGLQVGGLPDPTLAVTDLNGSIVWSMPCKPKKVPETELSGFGEGPGDAPIAEWEFVGGPVSIQQAGFTA